MVLWVLFSSLVAIGLILMFLHGPVWRELAELWQEAPQQCDSAT